MGKAMALVDALGIRDELPRDRSEPVEDRAIVRTADFIAALTRTWQLAPWRLTVSKPYEASRKGDALATLKESKGARQTASNASRPWLDQQHLNVLNA